MREVRIGNARNTFLMLVLLVIGVPGCTTTTQIKEVSVPNDFRQVVPFTNIAGKWILPIVINDIELNLMLDTGSTQVALFENDSTKPFFDFDNVNSFTKTRAFDRSGPAVESAFMKSAILKMNGFPEKNVNVTLFNSEQNPLFMYEIDGVIGFELLNKYDVRLDNQKMLATFTKGGGRLHVQLTNNISQLNSLIKFPLLKANSAFQILIMTRSYMLQSTREPTVL